jgi:hypothetical protein
MTTQWLTETELRSWQNFITSVHDLMSALESALTPHGLTMGDYEVLVYLSEAEKQRMRMRDLAAALQLSPSGLTRRLDGMVKNGWVQRAGCDEDKRVMWAHLTASGAEKMTAAAPDHVDSVRRFVIAPIGTEGVGQLGNVFGLIRENLQRSRSV